MTASISALSFVLIATAGSQYAYAPELVCYPVRPGDTAARFALRLTGSADNRHQPWFRIVDPAAARVIPKAEYGLILPGWRVCVARTSARARSIEFGVARERVVRSSSLAFLPWAALAVILLAALLAWLAAMKNLRERQALLSTMRAFGEAFVREFERPLFGERDSEHPVRSRLRFAPRRDRVEVLLAPAGRRTYPNLSDHRRNLEYDVERVLRLVGDATFSCGQLRAEGRWVVIPFQRETGFRKQEGVT